MNNCSLFFLHLTICKLPASKDVEYVIVLQRENQCWNLVLFCFLNILCIMPLSVFKIFMFSYRLDRSKPLWRVVRAMSNCSYSVFCLPSFTFILLLKLCLWHPIVPSLPSDIFYLQDECYCSVHSYRKWERVCVCVCVCVLHYHNIHLYDHFLTKACRLKVWYSMLQPSDLHFYTFCCFFLFNCCYSESVVRADPGCWPVCLWLKV